MSKLPFISDVDIRRFTKELLDAALRGQAKVDKNPYKNVIDPFSALVDAARQNISPAIWMEQEKSRQVQKSFQNAVGEFHQKVLGAMPGWNNPGAGGSFDVINDTSKIIAEVKNKFNTMNSSSALNAYDKMAHWLDYGKDGYTGYIVEVVPKNPKPYSVPFTPSERNVKRQTRDNLRRIDGKSFYAIASGHDDALRLLYSALPEIISDILQVDNSVLTGNKEFEVLFAKAYNL